ncbi:MAG: hypothetical protein ACTSVU_04125 [Promethearchaeota archaeon]
MNSENLSTKQLWKISKYIYREAFMQSQLEMAASNQAKLLSKMKKNRKYMTTQNIALKVVMVIYLGMMGFMPLMVFSRIGEIMKSGNYSLDWIIFIGSMILGLFFLIQLILLLTFGMFFASSLLSGESFKWMSTLPIGKRNVQKLVMFTFFRGINVEVITLLLAFPIGTALGTQNIILTLIALVVSCMNILFSFSLLIIVGEKIKQILRNNDINSWKTKIARISVMVGYTIFSVVIGYSIQFAMTILEPLFTNQTIANNIVSTLNTVFTFIPFPFNGSYLLIDGFLGFKDISNIQLFGIALGLLLFIFLIRRTYHKALSLLSDILKPATKNTANLKETNKMDVKIDILPPKDAFFKKDKDMATRDLQLMMMIIMPLLLPIIGFVSISFSMDIGGEEGIFPLLMINTIYLLMAGAMVILGVLNVETTGGSVLASLPIVIRDQAKAKLRWIFLLVPLSTLVQILFFINNSSFLEYLIISIIIMPIGILIGVFILLLKVRMFGKLKYKYVLEDINLQSKSLKWTAIIIILIIIFTVTIIPLGIFVIGNYDNPLINIAEIYLPVELVSAIILYSIFNKMFPKQKVYEM